MGCLSDVTDAVGLTDTEGDRKREKQAAAAAAQARADAVAQAEAARLQARAMQLQGEGSLARLAAEDKARELAATAAPSAEAEVRDEVPVVDDSDSRRRKNPRQKFTQRQSSSLSL